MQANLSWPQAKALADTGSVVRRAGWINKSIFVNAGRLCWLNAPDGSQRVMRASDFARGDFLALDYTDSAPNQGHCVGIGIAADMSASLSTLGSGDPSTITLSISEVQTTDVLFALSSSSTSLSIPSAVTILAGTASVIFTAVAGTLTASSNAAITATSNLCSCAINLGLQYVLVPPPPAPVPIVLQFSKTITAPPAGPTDAGWAWDGSEWVYHTNGDGYGGAVWNGYRPIILNPGPAYPGIPATPIPHPNGPPLPPVTDSISILNPWSSACKVVIAGTFYKTLLKGVSGVTLPFSLILPALAGLTLDIVGDQNKCSYTITATLSQ